MKIVFQSPLRLSEYASEAPVVEPRYPGAVFFKPFLMPGLYEDRIDLTVKPAAAARTYPYKRADESVN